ncbi:MAG: hypothetical protein V2A69_03155 [Pseudomonadota bacterium]
MKKRDDLSKLLLDKVIEAISAGKRDEAIKLVKQMAQENELMHDLLLDMLELSLTFISEKLGEESVEEVWRYIAKDCWKPFFKGLKDMDYDQMVNSFASLHRAHGSDFYVEQDDEKTVFVVKSCGGGGKLRKEGKLDYTDRHPMNGGTTKKAYWWSCDQTGVPYYCVHAPLWLDVLPREWGWPIFECHYGKQFDDDGNPIDDPCREIIYKQPKS